MRGFAGLDTLLEKAKLLNHMIQSQGGIFGSWRYFQGGVVSSRLEDLRSSFQIEDHNTGTAKLNRLRNRSPYVNWADSL